MKLDFEQIKKLAVGFDTAAVTDGRLYFNKCTKKQTDFWYSENQVLGERAETTSGVRLDFETDSKRFYAVVSKMRFEVKVNGVTVLKTEDGILDISLSGADRVTVVFPNHSRGCIESIELDDGATFTPHEHDMKMLFIGDSITQGYNSDYDSLCYSQRVTDFFNAESLINGIGGAYFAENSFDIPNFDPDCVIVAYGCNDLGHYKDFDTRISHADSFLKKVSKAYADKKLFYIVPIARLELEEYRISDFENSRAAFAKIAKGYGYNVIDGYRAVPAIKDFYADKVHPNDRGFSVYADYVIRKIQEEK